MDWLSVFCVLSCSLMAGRAPVADSYDSRLDWVTGVRAAGVEVPELMGVGLV